MTHPLSPLYPDGRVPHRLHVFDTPLGYGDGEGWYLHRSERREVAAWIPVLCGDQLARRAMSPVRGTLARKIESRAVLVNLRERPALP